MKFVSLTVVFIGLFSFTAFSQENRWSSPNCLGENSNARLQMSSERIFPVSNALTCQIMYQRMLRPQGKVCACETTRTYLAILRGSSRYRVDLKCSQNRSLPFSEWASVQSWSTTTPDLEKTKASCEQARLAEEPSSPSDACAAWTNANFFPRQLQQRVGIVSTGSSHQIHFGGREWKRENRPPQVHYETVLSSFNGVEQFVRIEATFTPDQKIQKLRTVYFSDVHMMLNSTRTPETWEEIRFDHNGQNCRPAQFLTSQGNTFELESCSRSVAPCQEISDSACFIPRTHRRLCRNFQSSYFNSPNTTQRSTPATQPTPTRGLDGQ